MCSLVISSWCLNIDLLALVSKWAERMIQQIQCITKYSIPYNQLMAKIDTITSYITYVMYLSYGQNNYHFVN